MADRLSSLPIELVLLTARHASASDDPAALMRLGWAGASIRRLLLDDPAANEHWRRAFEGLRRCGARPRRRAGHGDGGAAQGDGPAPPFAGSSSVRWRDHYLALLRSMCRECGCRPTPYVHALASSQVAAAPPAAAAPGRQLPSLRLCPQCEQALPRYRLITALEALEVHGVAEDQLRAPSGPPSVLTCGVRMWLASAVEGLARPPPDGACSSSSSSAGSSSEGAEEEEHESEEGDDGASDGAPNDDDDDPREQRRQARKAAKRAAKEAQRLRRAAAAGTRGFARGGRQQQQQQQERRGRGRQGAAAPPRRRAGRDDAGSSGQSHEKQRSGYVAERERLAAEFGEHAFSALRLAGEGE